MELQHNRVHLMLQAINEKLPFFNQIAQNAQFITVIITQFLLMSVSAKKEINTN